MIDFIRSLGRWGLDTLQRLGRGHLFLWYMVKGIPEVMLRFSLVIQQLHSVGVL